MAGDRIPANKKKITALDLKNDKGMVASERIQKITVLTAVSINMAVIGLVLSMPFFMMTVLKPMNKDDKSANNSAFINYVSA